MMKSASSIEWPYVALGSMIKNRSERRRADLPLLSVVRAKGVIQRDVSSKSENHNFIPDDLSNYKVVKPGDLAINKMKAWSGSLGVSSFEGLVSPAYYVYELAYEFPRYAHYLLRSRTYSDEFARCSDGIRVGQWDLSIRDMKKILVPLPTELEQRLITRYLDNVEMRIARAIRSKKAIASLLIESRRAVAMNTLRKGVVPIDILQDSGVSWLGSIPRGWEVRRVKTVSRINTGGKDTINRVDDGVYPFFVRSQTIERINSYSFDGEAVLTAGDGAGVGKVFHYINGPFDFHQRVYKFSNFRDCSGKYFFCYLSTFLPEETRQGTAKSTVDSLRLPLLANLPIALPPLEEQESIVRELERATGRIDAVLASVRQEIALLDEYRTRLIADVVTGKCNIFKEAESMLDVNLVELASTLAGISLSEDDEVLEDDDAD